MGKKAKDGSKSFKDKVSVNSYESLLELPISERSERLHSKLTEEEAFIERKFLIGIVVSDDCCKWAKLHVKSMDIQSTTCKFLTAWVFEFFGKFQKAPGKDIEGVFYEKLKERNIPKDQATDIEQILSGLSDEYSREAPLNIAYWKVHTIRYIKKRRMERQIDEISKLIENNELEEASMHFQFQEFDDGSLLSQIKTCACTSTEFINQQLDRPKRFLRPWLTEGSLNMIYGPRGIGKTWLCCIIGLALTRKDQSEIDIGPWQAKAKAGVLYVDAEMSNWKMQENIKKLSVALPNEDKNNPLLILSGHNFIQEYATQLNIAKKENRDALYKMLEADTRIKVMILDNVAALSPGIEENVKESWDPINQWLISLRHLGIATIIIHHAGKTGKQRGTSGREDAMDTIIKLEQPKGYNPERDYAWFKISFDKARNLQPGDEKRAFTIRIVEQEKEGLTWQEEEDGSGSTMDKKHKIMVEILKNRPNKEIVRMWEVSSGRVSQLRKEAKEQGYLNGKDKVTAKGEQFRSKWEDNGTEALGVRPLSF